MAKVFILQVFLNFLLIYKHFANEATDFVVDDILPCNYCKVQDIKDVKFYIDDEIDFSDLTIDLNAVRCFLSPRFLSFTIDIIEMKRKFRCVPLEDDIFNRLAAGISPAYLRVGGTPQDFLTFTEDAKDYFESSQYTCQPHFENWRHLKDFNLSYYYFDQIAQFAQRNNLKLIFGLNGRKINANFQDNLDVVEHSVKKGFQVDWQLGNEPIRYRKYGRNETVTGKKLAEYFNKIKLFDESSLLSGPDITHPKNKTLLYVQNFLYGHPNIEAVTYHHYFMHQSVSTMQEYINPLYLDYLDQQMTVITNTVQSINPSLNIWLGESGSSSGGGARNLSDSFVAGFLYLGTLGLAAKHCHKVVIRQSFYGGYYGMLDPITYNPLPDYWTSFIFKKLVGEKFLNSFELNNGYLRYYAFCSKDNVNDITLSYVNFQEKNVYQSFGDYRLHDVELYLLTPANGDLLSKNMLLNEKLLLLDNGHFPTVTGFETDQPFIIPKRSYGFVKIKNVFAPVCR